MQRAPRSRGFVQRDNAQRPVDGLKLPPHFQYAEGMDHTFRLHALQQVRGLRRLGHRVSKKFGALCQKYLGPYRIPPLEGIVDISIAH